MDWAYAKSIIVRKQYAQVLDEKIRQGQYSEREALHIFKTLVYETPQALLGVMPARKATT